MRNEHINKNDSRKLIGGEHEFQLCLAKHRTREENAFVGRKTKLEAN